MKRRLNVIFKERVDLNSHGEWSVTLVESCYQIYLQAKLSEEGDRSVKVFMRCAPCLDEGYELLLDYQLQVDDTKRFVEFDKWDDSRELLELRCADAQFDISLAINLREILAAQDLTVSTSYRNFHVLTFDSSFYVNTTQLRALGGKLFNEWYDREVTDSEKSAVVQSMNGEDLSELLRTACAYTSPIIHRRNFELILDVSRQFQINGLLRCVESFLMESTSITPIRKLEYAAEFRMARLADSVIRSFRSKLERIECLFEYLDENGESLHDVHPDVLDMCEIYEDYIVL